MQSTEWILLCFAIPMNTLHSVLNFSCGGWEFSDLTGYSCLNFLLQGGTVQPSLLTGLWHNGLYGPILFSLLSLFPKKNDFCVPPNKKSRTVYQTKQKQKPVTLCFSFEKVYLTTVPSQPPPGETSASPRLYLLLHHRLVPPPPAGLAGVRRSGEPSLCVEVLVKVVFSSKLS
jgi:hypothetical protein